MSNKVLKEIKLNKLIWILLVFIIVANTLFSENGLKYSYLLIISFSIIKFSLVLHQFVEVKNAHLVWKLVCIFFAAVYFIGVLVLY